MDQDKLKQHLHDLAENFDEILTSTAAVKGDAFAKAVSVAFEGVQMIELLGRMSFLAEEAHKEYATQLMESGKEILSSIVAKACEELDDGQFSEAMTMGHSMYRRRNSVVETIRKEMREDDE